VSVVEARKGEP